MGADGSREEQMQEPAGCQERIFVSVRLRPLNEKEIARHDVSDWECISDNTIIYRNSLSVSERSMYPSAYTFDRVFSSDCPNEQVYEAGAKEVALSVVSGINSSVFAYGQTSSGKTYTMIGITEYAMADIYDYIQRHKEREFILKFSAMEIYNESVRDLLSADSTPLRLLDDPERGTVVEKLTEETLRGWTHFKELLSVCEAQRQIGETSLNETSSRSHQILRLTIESSAREFLCNDNSSSLAATVNFVDLAGSERASQTLSAGARLKEGCHINRSLLTLGTVIRKLSKGRNGHIPFRDSKLTRILQSSLGGNSRTAIICTMSPARSHVEQSRNTLLFASCAKEVTTNAQVNVVVSDKALVRQLQRELARLENELRSAGTTSISSDSAALLREKDLEIGKLKNEVTILTQQRDLARSEVKDLQQVVNNKYPGYERPAKIWASPDPQYPKLRVRNSWDFENSITETPVLAVGGRSCTPSVRKSCSSEESFLQLPDFKLNIPHPSSSPQPSPKIPNFVGSNLCQEENGEHDENSETICKVVRCIDSGRSSVNRYSGSNLSESNPNIYQNYKMSSPRENAAILGLMDDGNEDRPKGESRSLYLKNNSNHPDIAIPSPEKQYLWRLKEEISSCRSLKLTRSRSCKATFMTGLASQWIERVEKDESTPPIGNEKDFPGRPDSFHRKLSALKYDLHNEGLSRNGSRSSSTSATLYDLKAQISRNESQSSLTSAAGIELKAQNVPIPEDPNNTGFCTSIGGTQLADHAVQVTEPILHGKTVKDVGLDPIPDGYGSPSAWPLEFKRLQREIIELWHACNVSMVHRTYFFLLFKGDPKDYIYMEVEHRRLSFLKNVFSHGNQTVENGRVLTPASSMKVLRRERHMLSQRMGKRLSKVERENLFLKWGIGLNTKHRRLQLAHRLWIDSEDMDHIAESAVIVATLVGFVDPEKAFKEMFGLNFTPGQRTHKRRYSLKRSLMSIL
ncbi:kinesin-like protein KIN-7H [Durio zibethinus]|uniref:Kinesin-like protein n=1 Tax=Durio zibethinus TaxID=66656 RepID=A0A6P6BE57_DURZI|nr:kinesin-like protein KIN-7H [Durio zibethinus]XP_022775402.1 kinesin-like protein KIN-7H [Durio zibethinus]XP_022775403.1 kinesin-like protein KIN-7H [Durio zibethinus]XP_022775404.1 kinesin-like protein KIN-7H [Durio zibethinus]XP_022775405.1 kinesin-like protein KIN-7H [Durio zibethinus]XP_022775406.1 kinesin-like protein KIN-7H [Durio zibethinus]